MILPFVSSYYEDGVVKNPLEIKELEMNKEVR